MYYIRTADRLTRTSVWLESMEGGIEYLRDVIVNDRLGIAAELERQMQAFVDSYQCEWKAVVDDPEKRRFFPQFANTDETEPGIEFVSERGQKRPADWPTDFVPLERLAGRPKAAEEPKPVLGPRWVHVGSVSDFPMDGGRAIKHGEAEIAVFRFDSTRRVVRLPEHLSAQARGSPLSRHHRRPARHPQGRLPAAQEDVFARIGRVLERRVVPGRRLPGAGRGRRRVRRAAVRKES